MKPMSMTAAIAYVTKAYGKPIRQSRISYVAYVPYDITEEKGPTTEVSENSYPKIMASLRYRKAVDAIKLMGIETDIEYEAHNMASEGSGLREIVKQLSK